MKVRVKFKKYGPIRFIGHLDVMRFFQKAIRRAEIDIAYTAGFSPHQIMSFAAPLGVGLESNGEYMDIELHTAQGSEELVRRLNEVSVPGIEITAVKQLPDNAENAMASVAGARYTVRMKEGYELPGEKFAAMAEAFLAKEQVLVTKETKRGTREVDLKPGIFQLQAREDGIEMLVDASSAGNIRPGMVMDVLFSLVGITAEPFRIQITREETYTRTADGELIPMDQIGADIP